MLPQVKKILYATDLSKNAQYAFSYAVSMAQNYGAKITILHASEEISSPGVNAVANYLGNDEWQKLKDDRKNEFKEVIDVRLKEFRDNHGMELDGNQGIFDKTILKEGNPANVILDESKKDYDMVILGTHGHGIFEGALLGNTARRVIRLCDKPVLVVRIPKDK